MAVRFSLVFFRSSIFARLEEYKCIRWAVEDIDLDDGARICAIKIARPSLEGRVLPEQLNEI